MGETFLNFKFFRVLVNKELWTGTVPVNKKLLTGTVLVNKKLLTGTVPVNNFYHKLFLNRGGRASFYYIILFSLLLR